MIEEIQVFGQEESEIFPDPNRPTYSTNPIVGWMWGWISLGKRRKLHAGDFCTLLSKHFGARLAWNELSMEPELDGQRIEPVFSEKLSTHLSDRGFKITSEAAVDAFIVACQKNPYHPIKKYLLDLLANNHLFEADINTLAEEYLAIDENHKSKSLYNRMLANCLVGAVSRVFKPGIKFDTALILQGKQGLGKSSFFKTLVGEDWFSDTTIGDGKDAYLQLHRGWVHEIQELDHLTNKKDAGSLKGLLSSSSDTFRVPYGRNVQLFPRPSILVGTCNRLDFLVDPTGNRRFNIISLPNQKINLEKIEQDRDRIWKAAHLAYLNGYKCYLTPDEHAQSELNNSDFEAEHPFYSSLYEWVNKQGLDGFSAETALHLSGCRDRGRITAHDCKEAGNALRELGFVQDKNQKRINGVKQPRLWRKSASEASVDLASSEAG